MAIGRGALRILDVGCGSGLALYYLAHFCRDAVREYVGIDMDATRLQKRWDFVRLPHTFHRVDLDDEWKFGPFDIIWCSEVIEHLIHDERLFSLMASHLASNGHLVLTTPNRCFVEKMARAIPGFDRVSFTQDGGHVRTGYEVEDFKTMAARNRLLLASQTWLSSCSVAEVRARFEGGSWNCLQDSLRHLIRSTLPSVGGQEQSARAEDCYSLAVSFVRQGEPPVFYRGSAHSR
jgi:SAM-dependent methyltransferase